MAIVSRPKSDAANPAWGSAHHGLLTICWQVRARPVRASTLRGSTASAARNHRWASAVSSARSSPRSASAAFERHSFGSCSVPADLATRQNLAL